MPSKLEKVVNEEKLLRASEREKSSLENFLKALVNKETYTGIAKVPQMIGNLGGVDPNDPSMAGEVAPAWTPTEQQALTQVADYPLRQLNRTIPLVPAASGLAQAVQDKITDPNIKVGESLNRAVQQAGMTWLNPDERKRISDPNVIPFTQGELEGNVSALIPRALGAGLEDYLVYGGAQQVARATGKKLESLIAGKKISPILNIAEPEVAAAYQNVGVKPGASTQEIRDAFHRAQMKYHTDVNPGAKEEFIQATKNFETIFGSRGESLLPTVLAKGAVKAAAKMKPMATEAVAGKAIPQAIMQDIYKGRPINQATRDKYPELNSGVHIINSPEDVEVAKAFRPKAVEAQKELDAVSDSVIAEIPSITKIKGNELLGPDIRAKSPTSAALKVNRRKIEENRPDYNISEIKDWARDTFIVKDMAIDAPKIVQSLKQKLPNMQVKTYLTKPHLSGYMGVFFNAKASNGVGMEHQAIMGDDGWALKLKTDEMYRPFRTMNFAKLNKKQIAEYKRLQSETHKMYLDFFAKKGYSSEGGSLSELESAINAAASSSVIVPASKNVAPGSGDLIQAPLAGENAINLSPSSSKPLSVNANLNIRTSNKILPQSTMDVKGNVQPTQPTEGKVNEIIKLPITAGKEVYIYKNPTDADLQDVIGQFREAYPNAPTGEVKVRKTIDEKGNEYIWMAGNATHREIEAGLKRKYGVDAGQNFTPIPQKPLSTPTGEGQVKLPKGYPEERLNYLDVQNGFLLSDGTGQEIIGDHERTSKQLGFSSTTNALKNNSIRTYRNDTEIGYEYHPSNNSAMSVIREHFRNQDLQGVEDVYVEVTGKGYKKYNTEDFLDKTGGNVEISTKPAVPNTPGLDAPDMEGRTLRGSNNPVDLDKVILETPIALAPKDGVGSVAEALQKANTIVRLKPNVTSKKYSLRYDKNNEGYYGNEKMAFPNASYPSGRNTYDHFGCGRGEFTELNGLTKGACYTLEGSTAPACYAEAQGRTKGRSVASGESTLGLRKASPEYKLMKEEWLANDQNLDIMRKKYPQYQFNFYPAAKGKPANFSIATKRPPKGADVSSNLEDASGQDVRIGVDTDASAWLAEPEVLDGLLKANPRTATLYSSAYYTAPVTHPLSDRSIIDVTVSGWHGLPETLGRLKWAAEARANGWNVVLRVVTADPAAFPVEAILYNRIIPLIDKSGFYYMEQPLHVGAKHGNPIMDNGRMPSCCKGSEANPRTCETCKTAEGLGQGFQKYWESRGGGDLRNVLPGVPNFRKDQGRIQTDLDKKIAGEIGRIKSGLASESGGTIATGEEIRKFIETVKNSIATDPMLAAIIDSRYDPKPNKVTLAEADAIINTDYNMAYALAMDPGKPSALSNTIAIRLLSQAQAMGNWEEAKRLVEMTAERNTAAGQAIQALAMYSKLAPEGITSYVSSVVNRATLGLKGGKFEAFKKAISGITDDAVKTEIAKKMGVPYLSTLLHEEIYNYAVKIQQMPEGREKTVATALMLKKIAELVPVDILKKISMAQTLAQLINPKTVIRNIFGNFGFALAEDLSMTMATGLDVMASLITKQRTQGLPNFKAQGVGFFKGGKEGLEEALLGIDTRKLNTKFDIPRNGVFNKGVMNALQKVLAIILQAPDRAFFEAAYMDSIASQCKLNKSNDITPEMIENAMQDGLYKTFQDNSIPARFLKNVKKTFNIGKGWGMGDMVIKYPATPGNIWARGFEYSPGGFIKTTYHLGRLIQGYEKTQNQKEFVRGFARAFTGSSLYFGVAAILAGLGIISGKRDPDRDVSALKRTAGMKSYQINVSGLKRFIFSGMDPLAAQYQPNDSLVSYDWALPISIPMVVGANMAEEAKRKAAKEVPEPGKAITEGIAEATNSLIDQPMLAGLARMRGGNMADWMKETLTGIPASFIPTASYQVSKLFDNTVRNTKDPNFFKQTYNMVAARVPGLSKTLPEALNTFGKPMKSYQGNTNNLFNVFLNPAFVTRYKPDAVSKMVLDIYQQTGETGHFPRVAPKSLTVDGRTINLKPDQYHDYQQYIGNKTGVLYTILSQDQNFLNMPDELKAQKLANYLADINTSAKIEIFGIYPKKSVQGQRQPYVPKGARTILNLE